MPKITVLCLLIGILGLGLVGCTPTASLSVEDVWARPALQGDNSAIYFTIHNPTSAADTLLSAETSIAGSTELHLSEMDESGNMSMQPQESVEIPSGADLMFKAGGYHVMLVGLTEELTPGDQFTLQLSFQNAGTLELVVEVKQP